jgi:adenylylsulfate kinase-like enzyme/gamma-glutamyl-gamma-aminobutyrate hydrolase PuuD
MKRIGLTQRVDIHSERDERRDAVDQGWYPFLANCGLEPVLIPNHLKTALQLLEATPLDGLILTGGNDLDSMGGNTPERDQVENFLIARAIRDQMPCLGVCRGMQALQHHFGVELHPVKGHVAANQTITVAGEPYLTNSYHNFGTTGTVPQLKVWAVASDRVVKAVRHVDLPLIGIMWHPERIKPFNAKDVELFTNHFNCTQASPKPSTHARGTVYWLTGLSGAGKTTVGDLLTAQLRAMGRPVIMLDGDILREVYGDDLGHTEAARRQVAARNSRICRFLASQGVDVVCCTISMFHDVRDWNRANIPNYKEIYLRVPMETLKERDPKGLYGRVLRGEIADVYGVDLEWEEPRTPDLIVDNDGKQTPRQSVQVILEAITNSRLKVSPTE